MTATQSGATVSESTDDADQPRTRPFDRERAGELVAAGVAAVVLVWAMFHLTGWDAPLGALVCWFLLFVALVGVVVRQRHGILELKDRLASICITAGTIVALIPLVLVLFYVATRGAPVVFRHFPSLEVLRKDVINLGPRDPVSKGGWGLKEAVIGTFEQVGLAILFSVPIGVLAATYLNEIGGRLAAVVRTVADAMTGLPSIIAGLFVYVAWVKSLGEGFSGLAAAFALAVVMLPTIVRTAEEVLRIVSDHLREAALALGAPEWRMVLRVVLPTARTGLVTAAILGVARAVGETAPVYLTAFGNTRTNTNPFHGAQDDLPLRIYALARAASDADVAAAWGGALLLTLIILTLFTLARILGTGSRGGRWSPSAIVRRVRQ
ncbi:MAG: phosphate ABC transporter permease PstA [Acidimicrobiales bacterium]